MASIKSRRESETSGEGGRKSSRDTKEERDFLAGGSSHFAAAPAHRAQPPVPFYFSALYDNSCKKKTPESVPVPVPQPTKPEAEWLIYSDDRSEVTLLI